MAYKKRPSIWTVDGPVATTTITRRNGDQYVVKIDSEDVGKICHNRWYVMSGRGGLLYVCHAVNGGYKNGKRIYRSLLLHRVVNDTPDDLVCDILNGDNMDCRKANLKNCKVFELIKNPDTPAPRSGLKGIAHAGRRGWRVSYYVNGGDRYIGYVSTIPEGVVMLKKWKAANGYSE